MASTPHATHGTRKVGLRASFLGGYRARYSALTIVHTLANRLQLACEAYNGRYTCEVCRGASNPSPVASASASTSDNNQGNQAVMQRPRLIVGISGATGIVYGIRLLQVARVLEIETHWSSRRQVNVL